MCPNWKTQYGWPLQTRNQWTRPECNTIHHHRLFSSSGFTISCSGRRRRSWSSLKLSDLEYYSVTTIKNCITKIKNSNTLYLPEKTRVFFYHVSVAISQAQISKDLANSLGISANFVSLIILSCPYAPANVTRASSDWIIGSGSDHSQSRSPRRPCSP